MTRILLLSSMHCCYSICSGALKDQGVPQEQQRLTGQSFSCKKALLGQPDAAAEDVDIKFGKLFSTKLLKAPHGVRAAGAVAQYCQHLLQKREMFAQSSDACRMYIFQRALGDSRDKQDPIYSFQLRIIGGLSAPWTRQIAANKSGENPMTSIKILHRNFPTR